MGPRRWSIAPLALLTLGGCHALLPLGGKSRDSAPASDRAVGDGAASRLDRGGEHGDMRLVDLQRLLDLGHPVDVSGPDSCSVVLPSQPPGCSEADLSPSCAPGECCGGGCDLLPDVPKRDPWPSKCNEMFVFQPFCTGSLAGWTLGYCKVSPSGILRFEFDIGQTGWTGYARRGLTMAAEDLLEVRFWPNWARRWKLHLVVKDSLTGPPVRGCVIDHTQSLTSFEMRHATGANAGSVETAFVSSPWLVLQSYSMGAHHCRIYDANKLLVGDSVGTPGASAFIELSVTDDQGNTTAGLDVEVDYLRAFRP